MNTALTLAATVLVVEDEDAQRELLRRWLASWGYNVYVADSARTALEAMLASPADILVADIRMDSGRDGLWLAERVREKWPRTQIVIASGCADIPSVMRAQRIGAVDFVTKPFAMELFRQAIERAEQKIPDDKQSSP